MAIEKFHRDIFNMALRLESALLSKQDKLPFILFSFCRILCLFLKYLSAVSHPSRLGHLENYKKGVKTIAFSY